MLLCGGSRRGRVYATRRRRWWTAAQQLDADARAYRFGQQQPVDADADVATNDPARNAHADAGSGNFGRLDANEPHVHKHGLPGSPDVRGYGHRLQRHARTDQHLQRHCHGDARERKRTQCDLHGDAERRGIVHGHDHRRQRTTRRRFHFDHNFRSGGAIMKRLLSALLVTLLAACGGGAQSTLPAANSAQSQSKAVSASIVIKIPPASATSSSKRQAYVSASTQSISGTINPAAGCSGCSAAVSIAANLTPTSSGCANSGGTTTCTIPVTLKPGSYVASVSTYSGVLSGGVPSGNELSTDQTVAVTITANTANTISMVMGGIPNSFTSAGTSGTNNSYVNSIGGELYLDGASSSITVTITPQDASGNAIIGPGAPTMTFSVTGGNGFTLASSTANSATVTAPAKGTTGIDFLNITFASGTTGACGASNAACSQQSQVEFMQRVAGTANAASSGVAWESPMAYQGSFENVMTVTSGLTDPRYLAFDSKGHLFVGDQTTNKVFEYPYPIVSNTPTATITLGGNLTDIVIDSSDNLIVSETGDVLEYDAPTYTTSHTVSGSALIGVNALAVSSSGTLYAVFGTNSVTPYTGAHYATAGTSFTSGLNNPQDAHIDASGNLWIANNGSTPTNGTVTEYSSTGALKTTISTDTTPRSISVDSADDVAMDDGHEVTIYAAGAYGTAMPVASTASPLWALDGGLVVQNSGTDIARCSSPTTSPSCGDLLLDVVSVSSTAGTIFKYPMAVWP